MAASPASPAKEKPVSIKMVIDNKTTKVVFVEARKDFVDVLLSFFTLPLGTIARLVSKDSNMKKVSVGSISKLYESVANLEEKHFWTSACKDMLLQPRSSMEECLQTLMLDIYDKQEIKYYICESWDCSRVSSRSLLTTFNNLRCKCGKPMNREISVHSSPPSTTVEIGKGFVSEMANFIVFDDLTLFPDDFQKTISLPMHLGYDDLDAVEVVTVNITQLEILDLLKCSLLSSTRLLDLFLLKNTFLENLQPSCLINFDICDAPEANVEGQTIKVKLIMVRKSNNKILFALGEADFADFILSFLTFPLGAVMHMLNGNCNMGSMDKLYKSIFDFDYDAYRSPDLKEKLLNFRLAHQFKLHNQILPIDEAYAINYFCESTYDYEEGYSGFLTASRIGNKKKTMCAQLRYLEPASTTGEVYNKGGGRGFLKRSSFYMVTDDLVNITQGSSVSTIDFLTKLKIPQCDLEQRMITIGKREGLSLLKASLISSSVLTDGLAPFLKIKNENIPK